MKIPTHIRTAANVGFAEANNFKAFEQPMPGISVFLHRAFVEFGRLNLRLKDAIEQRTADQQEELLADETAAYERLLVAVGDSGSSH